MPKFLNDITLTGTITVGVDDAGHDVKLFGATAGKYMLWDESADALVFPDATAISMGTGGGDLQIKHTGTNSEINNWTGHLYLTQNANNKDILFQSDDGNAGTTTYFTVDGGAATYATGATTALYTIWPDLSRIALGTSSDLQLYHDGTNSYITNATGLLNIATETSGIAVKIGHTTSETTINDNLNVTGNIACTGNITGQDNDYLLLGTGTDLQLYHNGTASAIGNLTGDLYIINSSTNSDILFQCDNGSGTATTYFAMDGGLADGTLTYTKWVDNGIIALGAGTDLKLWHNGTNSYIKNETGSFNIVQAVDDGDLVLKCDNGSGGTTAYLTLDGSAGTIVTAKSMEITGGITTSVGFNFQNCAAVYMSGLPSSDPVEAGRVWRSEEGYLLVSAGEGG